MRSRAKALVLSVLVSLLVATALPARPKFLQPPPVEHPSHQRLPGLDDMLEPEAALSHRLNMSRLRRLKKDFDPKQLDGDLGKLAERFLKDEKFLESLKGQFSKEDIEQLKKRFRDGKFSAKDEGFRKLLEKAKDRPDLTPRDRTALDKLAKDLPDIGKPDNEIVPNPEMPNVPPNVPPDPQNPPGMTPPKLDSAKSNDWLEKGLEGFAKNMDKWVDTPSGKSWAESMKKLATRAESGRASTADLGERTSALSKWMGKFSGRSPNIQPPRLGNPSMPNVPRVGVPSGRSLAGSGSVLVVLLGVLLLALILWRGREWLSSTRRAGRSSWQLGPWPVRPEDVTTRGDLVRAFEYLALLCLGPAARTCHHLELGRRIGGQPALDAERRRESAAVLSRLYERARYTPDREPLPGEDVRRARRELAYLAGG